MPKAVVASFGFDERFVVRALLRHGLKPGDAVLLVTGRLVEKVIRAFEPVKRLAAQAGAEAWLCEVEVHRFPELVGAVHALLRGLTSRYEHVLLLLSGGMRVIVLALYMAALLLPDLAKRKLRVELETEDEGVPIGISEDVLRLLSPPDLGAKHDVLELVVRRPGLSVPELQQALPAKHESTIRKQLKQLAQMGLVVLRGSEGRQRAWPTDAALVLAAEHREPRCRGEAGPGNT